MNVLLRYMSYNKFILVEKNIYFRILMSFNTHREKNNQNLRKFDGSVAIVRQVPKV